MDTRQYFRFLTIMLWLLAGTAVLCAQDTTTTLKTSPLNIEQLLAQGQHLLDSSPDQTKHLAHRALRIAYQKKDLQAQAKAHGLMGQALMAQTVHERALDHFLKQLSIYQQLNNWLGITHTYNYIALLYRRQLNTSKTHQYSDLALDLAEKFGFKEEIALAYNNIGVAYFYTKDYDKALQYFGNSIQHREELQLTKGLVASYNNMGLVFARMKKYAEALKWYEKSLVINQKEAETKHMKAATLDNMGDLLAEKGQLTEAKALYDRALKIAQDAGANMRIIETYESLYVLATKQRKHKEALEYHLLYTRLRDSLMSVNASVQIAALQQQFEMVTERKERVLLEKDLDLKKATIRRHKIISYSTIIGLGLMLLLAFVLYRSSRKDRKARKLMGQQSTKINEVNRLLVRSREKLLTKTEMLTLRNQQVTNSIRAAKLIQSAILPFDKRMQDILGEYFLLYLPKDIVSGDFYWMYQIGKVRYMAVADCTGHGVAGSLMSMLGYALLNEIVNKKIGTPALMLEELNTMLTASLRQEVTKNQAGMDIILCKITDIEENEETCTCFKVTYAGSRRPLYYTQGDKLIKVKSDKQFIGGYFSHYAPRPFKENEVVLAKGEQLYLTSDGFADTPNRARESFSSRRLFKLIESNIHLSLSDQKEVLEHTLETYQKGAEQRDDITILGFKL
ncbi:tetratricopeptide repeat protein [uncultured Microscilla sp.]|uniref:tetratricopeptide repeat protein n=1 Tax=uncultured Microscilla sp. TaxID=432653 RepID=UPI002614858C|nr:tetratricopeptide repeat protein [uncultured Microscilla sp.]